MSEQRESRKWFVVDQSQVWLLTGYICENAPGAWWFPQIGYTLHEKYHIFATFDEAKAAALNDLVAECESWEKRLSALQMQKEARP